MLGERSIIRSRRLESRWARLRKPAVRGASTAVKKHGSAGLVALAQAETASRLPFVLRPRKRSRERNFELANEAAAGSLSALATTYAHLRGFCMERAGIEPATSGLQSLPGGSRGLPHAPRTRMVTRCGSRGVPLTPRRHVTPT
jgi:hypothetical protein